MEILNRKNQKDIKIQDFDSQGVEVDSGVASFTIKDPDLPPTTENQYCFGFKYKGGDPSNINSWEYDHTEYWDHDSGADDEELGFPIPKARVEEILARHSTSLTDLLAQYCQKLGMDKKIN